MDDFANKSCWAVTAWAVAAFGAALLIAVMFGTLEPGAVITASAAG